LQASNDTREHAQDTGFASCRDCAIGRGSGEEAAIAGSAEVGGEDGELTFKLKDRSMNEGFFQEESGVVGGEAGGEVVGAIEEGVVGFEEFEAVIGIEPTTMKDDFDVRIDLTKAGLGTFEFGLADEAGVVKDLTVEIGKIDDVRVDEPDFSHPCGGEVKDRRRTQPTGADAEDGGVFELLLTGVADLRQHRLAKVAGLFLGRERHAGNLWGLVR